jgi:hypothetical protein
MINIYGPFLLILMLDGMNEAGLAMHEFETQADCEAAIVQLKPIYNLKGVCIAKEVVDD